MSAIADNPIVKWFVGIWDWIKNTWEEFWSIIFWIIVILIGLSLWHYFNEFMYPSWANEAAVRHGQLQAKLNSLQSAAAPAATTPAATTPAATTPVATPAATTPAALAPATTPTVPIGLKGGHFRPSQVFW